MNRVVHECEKTWRRLGVSSASLGAMSEELSSDLADAALDDVTPEAYVGGDPQGFARAWASSRGLVRPRWRILGTTVVALLAMIPSAFVAMVVPLATTSPWFIRIVQPSNPGLSCVSSEFGECGDPQMQGLMWVWAGIYLLALFTAWAGSLLGVSAWLRRAADPARVATVKALAVALPAGAVAAAAISYVWLNAQPECCRSDASTYGWPMVFGGLVAGTVALTRFLVVRSTRIVGQEAALPDLVPR